REAVRAAPDLRRDEVPSTGFVIDTLQAALWAFARNEGLEQVVVEAANLGGDADTVGAVAGALAGACYGASAIPERWLDRLEARDEITALADRLYTLSVGGS
ncbi:MAG: ADP-ribosylglycohydrolase family protein, partial [Thermomicrobiaceae bacterium]|nr:ADP-ribosylglycohydrolase family protein [Thermomicrobiaceae bacterium]